MQKYVPYLNIQHTWQKDNCWSLLERIYKDLLGVELLSWKRFGVHREQAFTPRGFYSISKYILNESNYWLKISLPEIKEFDIILFKSLTRPNIINHFGMYIGANRYIHLAEHKSSCISELNQSVRDTIYGIYRHSALV